MISKAKEFVNELMQTYNEEHRRYRGKPGRIRYSDTKQRTIFESFVSWCRENDIDEPKSFIIARIYHAQEESSKRYFPKPEQLKTAALLRDEMWRDLYDWVARCRYDQEELGKLLDPGTSKAKRIQTLASLRPAWERFKAKNPNREICASLPQYTGGFHPASDHCASCPQQLRCASISTSHWGPEIMARRTSSSRKVIS